MSVHRVRIKNGMDRKVRSAKLRATQSQIGHVCRQNIKLVGCIVVENRGLNQTSAPSFSRTSFSYFFFITLTVGRLSKTIVKRGRRKKLTIA